MLHTKWSRFRVSGVGRVQGVGCKVQGVERERGREGERERGSFGFGFGFGCRIWKWHLLPHLEKGIQTPMARGRYTKNIGGPGPVGCQ